jgi:glutathione S-transferase
MTITLYTLPPAFGLRNVSPFCLKVEMALNHLGLDFDIAEEADPRKAPRGKLPFLVVDGTRMPDSELIFEYLDKVSGGGLFGSLSPLEIAQGTAFTRLTEDHLYWIMVASRWLDDAWWPNIVQGFFGELPAPVRLLATRLARRQVRSTYHLQGLGRHSHAEQEQFARRDLGAISGVVEEQGYITGGRLTAFDFSVAGLLAGMQDQQPRSWINPLLDEFPALSEYAERVQAETGVYGRPVIQQSEKNS